MSIYDLKIITTVDKLGKHLNKWVMLVNIINISYVCQYPSQTNVNRAHNLFYSFQENL